MRLTDLKQLIKEDLKLDMSLTKVKRAKGHMFNKLQGDIEKEFALLWDYCAEIERSNEGSTTRLKVSRPLPESMPIFEGLYISIDCLKQGLLRGCRRVLGLDGSFLKGAVKGEVLAAVGRDGND